MSVNPATPHYAVVGLNPFDIYNDNAASSLPGGACNYVELSPGANGAKCGCRRFWARQTVPGSMSDQPGLCMCNHHACFHEDGGRTSPADHRMGQENERPTSVREPLSPMLDISMDTPQAMTTTMGTGADARMTPVTVDGPSDLQSFRVFKGRSQQSTSRMPDTLSWGDHNLSQCALPPIPSQCLMPSQTASTTSSIQAGYLRPFAGKGLDTLPSVAVARVDSPLRHQKYGTGPEQTGHSSSQLTAGGPNHAVTSVITGSQQPIRESKAVSQGTFQNLTDLVSGHDQRLDRLESKSFSAPGYDDCVERHDHMDLRVTDLESKVEDMEKVLHDNGSVVDRRGKQDDIASVSAVSAATSISQRTNSQDYHNQVQHLQARVDHLQSLLPTYSHVRQMEVVFLPFPLKRIWQDVHQFRSDASSVTGNDTQMPMTFSTQPMQSPSQLYEDWVLPDHDAEWLLPRAFREESVVDMRLRSRGFIKSVTFNDLDARSVHQAIVGVFGDIFRALQAVTYPRSQNAHTSQYLGLQCPWIPLRKVHKDSRLRFLSPAEMVSPASWNVHFLHSVMMRSSKPRLFITHPEAYFQDLPAYESGFTWQRLREMDRIYPAATESQEVPEADALEKHWTWHDQLDEPPSALTSMKLRRRLRRSVSISPSLQEFAPERLRQSASPSMARHQSPMDPPREGSQYAPVRIASTPAVVTGNFAADATRRRIASFGQQRQSSPLLSQAGIHKRRRTRSPSYARHTPRWTASPSPAPSAFVERQRGTTPFAYATPHSNAPLQEIRITRDGSVSRNTGPDGMDRQASHRDELYDVEIYADSASEQMYDGENDDVFEEGSRPHPESPLLQQRHITDHPPEDEPWPGIEDQAGRDGDDAVNAAMMTMMEEDSENVDPNLDGRHRLGSSQPSEYPSTQMPATATAHPYWADFDIHEDDMS